MKFFRIGGNDVAAHHKKMNLLTLALLGLPIRCLRRATTNVSPPPRHCVCPNPKQAKGPLRGHNIPSPKKSITFPSILTYFIQIWTEFLQVFNQVVKHVIILLILLHTFGGSNIYNHVFFLLLTKMEELFTTLFYI